MLKKRPFKNVFETDPKPIVPLSHDQRGIGSASYMYLDQQPADVGTRFNRYETGMWW